jgi:hypothetical protein
MTQRDRIVISRRDRIAVFIVVGVTVLGTILLGALLLRAKYAAEVNLSVAHAGPRTVEEQTGRAILRDYSAAWASRTAALQNNDVAALGDYWVGFARQDVADAIAGQRQSGVSVRYIDRGHRVEAMFYSPEGSALELHHTNEIEHQILDGSSVIHSERVTAHYIVVMTPTSDRWQVRLMQSVPNF